MEVIRLKKDPKRLPTKYVGKVLIQTNANLYSGDPLYSEWENCGYIEQGSIIITAPPITFIDINGSTVTTGYNGKIEIGIMQIYGIFEYEKFVNKMCTISLPGIKMYIPDIILNLDVNFTPGDNKKAPLKLSGTKNVETLEYLITDNPWPVTGAHRVEPFVNQDNTLSIIGGGEGGFYNDDNAFAPPPGAGSGSGIGVDLI
jgi:hypothetical protein